MRTYHIFIKLFVITILLFLMASCGNEGYIEGLINNTPVHMDVDDVIVVRGESNEYYYISDPYYNSYNYNPITNPMTIYLGYDPDSPAKYPATLIIYVLDMNLVYQDASYYVPSNNIRAVLEYKSNNQTVTSEAIEGGYMAFYEVGLYEGEEISGAYSLIFNDASLNGSFSTKIGFWN